LKRFLLFRIVKEIFFYFTINNDIVYYTTNCQSNQATNIYVYSNVYKTNNAGTTSLIYQNPNPPFSNIYSLLIADSVPVSSLSSPAYSTNYFTPPPSSTSGSTSSNSGSGSNSGSTSSGSKSGSNSGSSSSSGSGSGSNSSSSSSSSSSNTNMSSTSTVQCTPNLFNPCSESSTIIVSFVLLLVCFLLNI